MRFIVLAVIAIAGLAMVSIPNRAECAWCPSYACYGSCAGDCVCLIPGGEVSGRCVSLSMLPEGGE